MGQLLLGNYMEPGADPLLIDRLLAGIGRSMGDSAAFLEAATGCESAGPGGTVCAELRGERTTFSVGCSSIACESSEHFEAAVAAAQEADAIIVVLGLRYDAIEDCINCTVQDPPDTCATSGCESEGFDRISLDLPPNQYELVRRLRNATRRPLIGLFIHGGVFALKNLAHDLDAMVDAWYPGPVAGGAVADVLFGRHSPAGRTPVTWYASTADLPANRSSVDWYTPPGYSYRFFQRSPAFPFGHGLSFTHFQYTHGSSTTKAGACDAIAVRVSLGNVGDMDSDEVVQVYIKPLRPRSPQPKLRLCAFRRLHVLRDQRVQMDFVIEPKSRAVVFNDEWLLEDGDFEIWVGGGQPDLAPGWRGHVTITGSSPLVTCGGVVSYV